MPEQLGRLRDLLAGRYQIEREVGRGGMAVVYRALDIQHDRPVALKVLKPDLALALGGERFQREIKLAARLQHPHILGVYDSGTTDGYLWFTMPFVEGESLRDRLDREGALPVSDAVRICREAALALDFAHKRGVVHRDIKPENILLIDGQAMVADFGIARAIGGDAEGLTGTGMVIGTPGYMSPEQAAGESKVDPRSDIYSLGCVLYELLAGEPPFTGPTVQAVIARVLTESARPVTAVRPTISPQLGEVVSRAMAKQAADRPATGGEFARQLEAAATMPVPTQEIARPPKPRWMPIAAAIALLAIGALGVRWFARTRMPAGERKIVVLPFDNEGSAEDDYFADGMADEVRTRLSALHGMRVTARASSTIYKKTSKSPRDIAHELDVQYVLTGTVRWMKAAGVNRVKVTPELIDVSSMETRWSQPYDTVLSDVFAVQASIASQVAGALHLAFEGPSQDRLEERATVNLEAYDEFLKGQKLAAGGTSLMILTEAIKHYEQAVQLDSTFLRAWSELAIALSSAMSTSPTKEGEERARQAAARAMQLGPNRPEALRAMGAYLVYKRDLAGAKQKYGEALKLDPNNVDIMGGLVSIARVEGSWDEALSLAKRVAQIDPQSVPNLRRLAMANGDLFHYADALPVWDRILTIAPGQLQSIQGKAGAFVYQGELDSAHALIRKKLETVDTTALLVHFSLYLEQMWLLPPDLWPKITQLTPANFANDRGMWALKMGRTWLLLGDTVRARAFGDSSVAAFEAKLRDFPDNATLQEQLGRGLALSGQCKEANAIAERSLQTREPAAYARSYIRLQAARVFVQCGANDRALDLLEPLLSTPSSNVTPGYLQLDPTFAPLKRNPRFQRLING
jgi:serine/threonine-protein kinase